MAKIDNTSTTTNLFYRPLIIVGTLLYPIYALPWIFKSIVKNENMGYFLFALSMAYFSYLMIPYNDFDLTRHYQDFERMSAIDFDQIMTVDPRIKHYFFNVYLWILNQIGLSKQFAPFFMTFIKYLLYFMTFKRILRIYGSNGIQSEISYKWFMLIFLVLLIGMIRFVGDTSGLRNSFAFAIFIFAIMRYYLDNKRLSTYILLLFSTGVHLSLIPLVFLFILANIIKANKLGRVIFVIFVLLLFLGLVDKLFFTVIGILKPYLQAYGLYFPGYMSPEGKWGPGFWVGKRTAIVLLEKYINPSAFYIAALYLLVVKELTFERIKLFLYLSFSLIVLVSISRTMLSRYAYFFELLFVFVLMSEYLTKPLTKFKKIFLILFLAATMMIKLAGIYRYRIIYADSWSPALVVPAPVMMLREIRPNNYIVPNSGG